MIPLSWYLLVSAALFCIGLYGVLARRNAVAILMAVELMLNAVNSNLIAIWRYGLTLTPTSAVDNQPVGITWAVFVLAVAAAEAVNPIPFVSVPGVLGLEDQRAIPTYSELFAEELKPKEPRPKMVEDYGDMFGRMKPAPSNEPYLPIGA